MAKQLQLRRGSYLENETFIGAEAEMTFDTERKDIRIHDGVKRGGYMVDTLIDFQIPTADNGYTWYRKYASGWVEQGGYLLNSLTASNTSYPITLPVEMADVLYSIQTTTDKGTLNNEPGSRWLCHVGGLKSSTQFSIFIDNKNYVLGCYWQVSGLSKQN